MSGSVGGPYSPYAPDDFAQYGNNKYCWMWAHSGNYQGPDQIAAGVPELRSYVSSCIASRPE